MNPFKKLAVVLALVALATLASGSTAMTATGATFYSAAAGAAGGVCGCCPRTCQGGTFIGCYNTIFMPPNAVTCVYMAADGTAFDCVSCINKAVADPGNDTGVGAD